MKKPVIIDLRGTHRLVQKVVPHCPTCSKMMDGATGGTAAPEPGNLSVCIDCFTVSEYIAVPGGMSLRELPQAEFDALPDDVQLQILFVSQSLKQYRKERPR